MMMFTDNRDDVWETERKSNCHMHSILFQIRITNMYHYTLGKWKIRACDNDNIFSGKQSSHHNYNPRA